MKSLILFITLALFSVSALAFADTIVIPEGLSDAQIAEIKAQATRLVADNLASPSVTAVLEDPDVVLKYAQVGEAVAKGIGAAAKEMGVAANEFMGTSAGLLTVVLIVYHFIGAQLISLVVAGSMVPIVIWIYMRYLRWVRTEEVTIDESGKVTRIMYKTIDEEQAHALVWPSLGFLITIIVLLIIALP